MIKKILIVFGLILFICGTANAYTILGDTTVTGLLDVGGTGSRIVFKQKDYIDGFSLNTITIQGEGAANINFSLDPATNISSGVDIYSDEGEIGIRGNLVVDDYFTVMGNIGQRESLVMNKIVFPGEASTDLWYKIFGLFLFETISEESSVDLTIGQAGVKGGDSLQRISAAFHLETPTTIFSSHVVRWEAITSNVQDFKDVRVVLSSDSGDFFVLDVYIQSAVPLLGSHFISYASRGGNTFVPEIEAGITTAELDALSITDYPVTSYVFNTDGMQETFGGNAGYTINDGTEECVLTISDGSCTGGVELGSGDDALCLICATL